MPKVKPAELAAEARRRNLEQLARLGGEMRTARHRRQMTQQQLAAAAGISRSAESAIERGLGGGQTLDTWQRVALAAGRPLIVELQRDRLEETRDAGHLAIQELVLRLGRRSEFSGSFELQTRPAEPWRSTDVGLRDDHRRVLLLIECWNTFGDIGAATRSSERKRAEAAMHAVAIGGEHPHRVATCWVVRATKRNRSLVARYPEVFRARFPGSSLGWVRALTSPSASGGSGPRPEAPFDAGLVWCDIGATRLFPWRYR
jgi:transcriptional regulator with XRE-family HTH domain